MGYKIKKQEHSVNSELSPYPHSPLKLGYFDNIMKQQRRESRTVSVGRRLLSVARPDGRPVLSVLL